MEFKFSKDADDSHHQEAPPEKKNQSALLLLLLILVGGFGYVYIFTDLVKPLEVQKTAETVIPAPPVTKIPLPAREGEPAKPENKAPEKTGVLKTVATNTPSANKPALTKPALPPAAKTADKKASLAVAPDKKNESVAAAKAGEKKTAVQTKKIVVATNKSGPAKDSAKNSSLIKNQTKPHPDAKSKKHENNSWSLIVGNYVLEEDLAAEMGRVRKAGFKPTIEPSSHIKTTMNRLLISEFNDRATAQSSLKKLSGYTSDAFVMEQGGKFAVYAGSYLQSDAANTEKERLKAAGFTVAIKRASIAIPSQRLSIGPFKNKKTADSALLRLKSAGIKATLSQK
ncbi:MAG: SPOR domain-containing protein [Desulfuromonadaceae bacterium]|nr:SPOR domain-containing protein [Desulfuromonadaceae bacterium]